jgi:hypothetical protein
MAEPNLSDPARLLGTLGMENAQAKFDAARKTAKVDKKRFDDASEPVTSDTGVPDKLIEGIAAKRKAAAAKYQSDRASRQARMYPNTKGPMDPSKLIAGSED